ncbi:MAG: ParB/RepB/Spo0J family partition protein, partial [Anaerolineales bacterium]
MGRRKTKTEQIERIPHTELQRHPQNMRKVYPEAEIRELAESIKGRGEIIQPLIGVRQNGDKYVVAGNKRLTACYLLGDEAPLVPIIFRELSAVEQMLDMVVENMVRSKPDAISEALHYQAILNQPGMNVRRLSQATGVMQGTIANRLKLLELEKEIQELIAAGQLPRGKEAVEALLSIRDSKARVETAKSLAGRKATVGQIKAACTRVRRALAGEAKAGNGRKGRLRLDGGVRDLMARGLLPNDEEVVAAFLEIDDMGTRQELASLLARDEADVERVKTACAVAAAQVRAAKEGREATPALDGVAEAGVVGEGRLIAVGDLVDALREACGGCGEVSWAEVTDVIRNVCGTCGAQAVTGVCGSCALVAFVN